MFTLCSYEKLFNIRHVYIHLSANEYKRVIYIFISNLSIYACLDLIQFVSNLKVLSNLNKHEKTNPNKGSYRSVWYYINASELVLCVISYGFIKQTLTFEFWGYSSFQLDKSPEEENWNDFFWSLKFFSRGKTGTYFYEFQFLSFQFSPLGILVQREAIKPKVLINSFFLCSPQKGAYLNSEYCPLL